MPFLPELIDALERHGELPALSHGHTGYTSPSEQRQLSEAVRAKLLTLSAATCDRLLSAHRRTVPSHGKSTTKPGTLLKHQIPIRTFADWQDSEKRPGFCEIDLVSHASVTGPTAARPPQESTCTR